MHHFSVAFPRGDHRLGIKRQHGTKKSHLECFNRLEDCDFADDIELAFTYPLRYPGKTDRVDQIAHSLLA